MSINVLQTLSIVDDSVVENYNNCFFEGENLHS